VARTRARAYGQSGWTLERARVGPASRPAAIVSYGIGRVCELHVLLDCTLGTLQAELAILANPSDPEVAFRPTVVTARRIARCQELLSQSDLPQDLRIAGDHALEVAQEANERRNRVVHDAWLERIERTDGNSFTRVRISGDMLTDEPSDLDFVQDAEQRIVSVRDRARALLRAMNRVRNADGNPMPEGLTDQELIPSSEANARSSKAPERRRHAFTGQRLARCFVSAPASRQSVAHSSH
jgi:hypothetical protein